MSPFWILLKQDDGSGGDNWSYTACKAPAKLSPSTNQHPVCLMINHIKNALQNPAARSLPAPITAT